jgi:hypothetical protein
MGSNPIGKCLRTTVTEAASEGDEVHKQIEILGEEEDKICQIEDRLFIVERRVDLR